LLEFDAFMNTQLPYVNLAGTIGTNVALYEQLGRFRVRVVGGAAPVTNRLALIVELFSWTYQARTDGTNFDFIHVRNRTNAVSSGWIETTALSGGQYLFWSELSVWPEGVLLPPFVMDYTPAENPPARFVLKGIARTLEILHVNRTESGAFQIHGSYLGPNYRYGMEYSTNGSGWSPYTITNIYGDPISWFDDTEPWRWNLNTSNAPMSWFRLKARPFP
jgi:hypothetical protein